MLNVLPKRVKFEELLGQLSRTMAEGVLLLARIVQDGRDIEQQVRTLKDIEHAADDISHTIYNELNRSFITPFDREDLHLLASALDDVLDFATTAGLMLVTYKISPITEPARELSRILVEQCEELQTALALLKDSRRALQHAERVTALERNADDITRRAYADLFDSEPDPIHLIKLKDLYRQLEWATDRADDAANVIEAIVLKSS
ncbi:MAG: DUF47 domain-containing protein [Terriglobales bacterium]